MRHRLTVPVWEGAAALASAELDAIIDSTLAQLIVRQLDEELVLALKQRAARSGRSAEAEHREILREVLGATPVKPSFKDFLRSMPPAGDDDDCVVPRDLPREPAL